MAAEGPKLRTAGEAPFARASDFNYRRRFLFIGLRIRCEQQRSGDQQQDLPLSTDHASRPSLTKNQTIASEPTPSIHHAPTSH